jgi:hypothetical protein
VSAAGENDRSLCPLDLELGSMSLGEKSFVLVDE